MRRYRKSQLFNTTTPSHRIKNGIRAILNVVKDIESVSSSDNSNVPDPSQNIVRASKGIKERVTMNCYSDDENKNAIGTGRCVHITELKPSIVADTRQLEPDENRENFAGRNTPLLDAGQHFTSEFHTVDFEFSPAPLYSHFVRIDDGMYLQHENPMKAMLDPSFDYDHDMHPNTPNTATLHVAPHSSSIIVLRNKSLLDHPIHLHGTCISPKRLHEVHIATLY